MPTTIATMEQGIATNPINVTVNIDKSMLEVEVKTKNFEHLTQEALLIGNLSLMLHLLVRNTHNREALVDYSYSHVVILIQYLNII
jgi:hypothetical protein